MSLTLIAYNSPMHQNRPIGYPNGLSNSIWLDQPIRLSAYSADSDLVDQSSFDLALGFFSQFGTCWACHSTEVQYASAVGSLMYAMVCMRPDITWKVGTLSRYMSNPGREHWATVKWILRYLKCTSRVCLRYGFGKRKLEGFTNSNMSGNVDSS